MKNRIRTAQVQVFRNDEWIDSIYSEVQNGELFRYVDEIDKVYRMYIR